MYFIKMFVSKFKFRIKRTLIENIGKSRKFDLVVSKFIRGRS